MEVKILNSKIEVQELYESVSRHGAGSVSLFVGDHKDIFQKSVLGTVAGESRNEVMKSYLTEVCSEVKRKCDIEYIGIFCWLDASVKDPCIAIACLACNYQKATEAVDVAVGLVNGSQRKLSTDQHVVDVVPANLIQVRASCEEINQRINSFIERRREQVNVYNIRDFCCAKPPSDDTSCARVDAVKIHRKNSRSHLRVRKVHNSWGPQTVTHKRSIDPSVAQTIHGSSREILTGNEVSEESDASLNSKRLKDPAWEERIRNVEEHIGIASGSASDVHVRLKKIEDKILYMEGLSPEYFTFWGNSSKEISNIAHTNDRKRAYTSAELSDRIKQLECSTLRKSE